MSQESQVILCPYCGHPQSVPADQPMPDQCEECGGLFEPLSRRATQISMGPWYIRNKANPFMPGCSFDVMERMAKGGKLKPTTVMRGPTTKQFWSVARNVPGIANLLGYCHSCGTKVNPTDAKCTSCKTLFTKPKERNELGLPFKTKAEADAAQRSLDKEITAITGASNEGSKAGSPPPAPTGDLLSSVLGTGMTNAVPGGDALFAGGPSAPTQVQQPFAAAPPQVPTGSPSGSPSPFGQQPAAPPQFAGGIPTPQQPAFGQPQAPQSMAPTPQQPMMGGQPGFGAPPQQGMQSPLGANAVAAFNTGGPNAGEALNDLEKKNKMVGAMTWGLVGFNAILILVVIVLFVMNRDDPSGSEPTKDTDTKDTGGNGKDGSNKDGSSGGNSRLDYKPMKINDNPLVKRTNVQPVVEPTPTVDPAVRIAVNEKLAKVQEAWATGDLQGAKRMLAAMKQDYGSAALPTNMDTLVNDLNQQISFKDKLSEAEHLWQGGELEKAYLKLIDVRDNYPREWLPGDFNTYIAELKKQGKDNNIEFFGLGSGN